MCYSGGIAPPILNFGVVGDTLRPLFSRGKNPGVHWVDGWVGLRAALDTWDKIKFFASAGNRSTIYRRRSQYRIHYTSYPIPSPFTPLTLRFYVVILEHPYVELPVVSLGSVVGLFVRVILSPQIWKVNKNVYFENTSALCPHIMSVSVHIHAYN